MPDAEEVGIPYGTREWFIYAVKLLARAAGWGIFAGTVLCVLILAVASILQAL